MQRKLTIMVDEDVYEGLQKVVGRRKIGRFLQDLARPLVVRSKLESEPSVAPTIRRPPGGFCPGCGQKEFKRWPWGWDAHAAHSCQGLSATDPEERKAEFRRRFANYFPH
jgi:hypothetical protein